jgi:hypothetical protein
MFRMIVPAIASSFLVVSGVVHGLITDRWIPAVDLQQAAARMDNVPMKFGDWDGHEITVSAGSVDPMLTRHMDRRYVNRLTGESVTIALVVGRSGPVSIHTPEVCYSASGYVITPLDDTPIPGRNEAFYTMDALRTRVGDETRIRLFWAWNAGTGWMTSASPRVDFANHRVLFKLYVTRDLLTPGGKTEEDLCVKFMHSFLPILDEALFTTQ